MLWYLADLYLDSMSINVCWHINKFGFVYENINMYLPNYHIWNYKKINSHITQTYGDILFKFSGFSIHIDYCKVIEDWKPKLLRFQKFSFSGVGLLAGWLSNNWPSVVVEWTIKIGFAGHLNANGHDHISVCGEEMTWGRGHSSLNTMAIYFYYLFITAKVYRRRQLLNWEYSQSLTTRMKCSKLIFPR